MWFVTALCSLFSKWPAGSAVIVLSCKLNGQGSRHAWAIFSLTFHFQLNYSFFFVGRVGLVQLGLVGLGSALGLVLSFRVSFYVNSMDSKSFDMFVY